MTVASLVSLSQQKLRRRYGDDDEMPAAKSSKPRYTNSLGPATEDVKWRKQVEGMQQKMQMNVDTLAMEVHSMQREFATQRHAMDRMADAIVSLESALIRWADSGKGRERQTDTQHSIQRRSSSPMRFNDRPLSSRWSGPSPSESALQAPRSSPATRPMGGGIGPTYENEQLQQERMGQQENDGQDVRDSLEEKIAAREARRRADEQMAMVLAEASSLRNSQAARSKSSGAGRIGSSPGLNRSSSSKLPRNDSGSSSHSISLGLEGGRTDYSERCNGTPRSPHMRGNAHRAEDITYADLVYPDGDGGRAQYNPLPNMIPRRRAPP